MIKKDLKEEYSNYYHLERRDAKNQSCTVKDHLNILKNPLREEIFLKILSLFPNSTEYLKPVNKPKTAFFRVFWRKPNGTFYRFLGLITRPHYLGLNIGMEDIPNYQFFRQFTSAFFSDIGMCIKYKDRKIPKKNTLVISPQNGCHTVYIIDDQYKNDIFNFVIEYRELFNQKAIL